MAVGKPNPVGALTGANDGLADNIISHAVNLERLKASEVQAVYAMLRKVQGDLIEQLNSLDPTAVGGKTQANRLVRLLKNTQATIRSNYTLIKQSHTNTLAKVADLEGKAVQQAVGQGVAGDPKVGAALMASLPPATTLRALVDGTLIMGAPHKEHWARQAGDLQQRFQDQMREGILAGEGVDDLVRRIRGSKANAFKDGIMEVKRHQAAALVRTSVQAVSNAARNATITANADIFNGVQWLSTLDGRTSDICKARSGLRWDNDFKPMGHSKQYTSPPAHWNCRSVVTPVTKSWDELAGKTLTKNAEDFSDNFKNELLKLGFTAAQISRLKPKMQSSMDGMVPAEFSYEDWIKSKPEVFQQQVLGAPKWRLWNSGKIAFVDLVDQRSNPLSLADLQELIDAGKTSIARASTAAKTAAKAEAAAAAKEATELAKKESQAELLVTAYAAGGKGLVNFKASHDKLKKQGKLEGKTFQEQAALVQAGKDAIDTSSKLSDIKKKFKNGKKLSPSELAVYQTLDAATKEEFATLKEAGALAKQVDQELATYGSAFPDDLEIKLKDYDALGLAPANLQVAVGKLDSNADKLAAIAVAKDKAASIVSAEKVASAKIDAYITSAEKEGALLTLDKVAAAIKGKANPGTSQKTYLAALDEAAEVEVAKLKALDFEAAGKLAEYKLAEQGSGMLTQKKVLTELEGDKSWQALGATQKLAKVDEVAAQTKAKADFNSIKSTVSTQLATNQSLKPAQAKWVSELDEDGKDLLQAAVVKKQKKLGIGPAVDKAPPATADNKPQLVFTDFEQVGQQGGSNLGGLFTNQRTGTNYYIKAPESELAARVEVLTAKLYQMAGVRTADIDLLPITGEIGGVNAAGRLGIASRIEAVTDLNSGDMRNLSGAKDGFAADAWLANWDVIGNGAARELNLKKLADGTALRIDTGGSLFFRAQGARKAFDANDVPELDSLRDSRLNANAADVFGDINEDQIVAGVARIVAVSDDDIRRLVADTMGDAADDLADILIGRKRFLANKYQAQLDKLNESQPTPNVAGITKVEERSVQNSGSNGYSIATDQDQIEDQMVHFSEYSDKAGKLNTQLVLKVRGDAAQNIDDLVARGAAQEIVVNLDEVDEAFVNAIKGVVSRALAGEGIRELDFDRIENVTALYASAKKRVQKLFDDGSITALQRQEFLDNYDIYDQKLVAVANKYKEGDVVAWTKIPMFVKTSRLIGTTTPNVKGGLLFKRKAMARWDRRSFKDGKAFFEVDNPTDFKWKTVNYVAEIDGVSVRYFPSDSTFALQNRIEISSLGSGAVTIEKQLSVLRKLGINTARATTDDREELYLMRSLYIEAAKKGRGPNWWQKRIALFSEEGDQAKRLKVMRKEYSKALNVKDVTQLPMYRPLGDWQQFGQGRITQMRTDLHGAEWEIFQQDYILHHSLYSGTNVQAIKAIVESGGQMAPTADRLRRGIVTDSMSPERDLNTGGASYFFTRWRKRRNMMNESGLKWKARQAARVDSISYNGDKYGETTSARYVLGERGVTVDDFINNEAASSRNETIFKDSLSIYEDLEHIVADSRSDRREIISYLKTKMDKWPDGRDIESVVLEAS